MRNYLDKLGTAGAIVAAAACPICFPKLALIGALFGLSAFSAHEFELLIAANLLVGLAVAGHVLAFRGHRCKPALGIAIVGGAAFFSGLYLHPSELLSYAGLAALLLASATDLTHRLARGAR